MDRVPFPIVAAGGLVSLVLAACGGGPSAPPQTQPKHDTAEAGYVTPPQTTGVRLQDGRVVLTGLAAPRAVVRLATPGGQAATASADADGRWTLSVPAAPATALYGLSQQVDGRTVQAQGYLLVTPVGQGVLLRAGAGAVAVGDQPAVGVTAFDVDRDGGAVVSGRGQAGSGVTARIDGRKLGEGRIDDTGRFALPLTGPVGPGTHSLKVFGDQLDTSLVVDASPAQPLTAGPFRATSTAGGLRVDWMTPGGGVQTTLVARQGPESGDRDHRVIP